MHSDSLAEPYRELRRELHRHPEPAWCEFYTTARLIAALESRAVDEIQYGEAIHTADSRHNVPDADTIATWRKRARAAGVSDERLEQLGDGLTGVVAVVDRGPGPAVALRVDIDALPIAESESEEHHPAAEGFRSENEGYMHACGHDAHATIGIGVLDRILDSEFSGIFKLILQPAEEVIAGAKSLTSSGVVDDVDTLFAVHVGLDHPSGEVVAGIDEFLAVRQFRAAFEGDSAHAGARPEAGNNAVQAMAAAVQNCYGIPRHADGKTRINTGVVGGGTASNIIPEAAFIEGEVRGETTQLMEQMWERTTNVLAGAAMMHNCDLEIEQQGDAPSAHSDGSFVARVAATARQRDSIETVCKHDSLGGSEDATYLMERVQELGGEAVYVGIGTDHPGGHHTPTFDVVERDIQRGVDVLAEAILTVTDTDPG